MIIQKRSQIWISAVLYVLIISVVLVIVLEAGVPILDNLRDKSVFIQTRDNFVSLDKHIKDISNAGPGSQRIVPLEIKKGELSLGNSQLEWMMDTKSAILQPRTSVDLGNLRLGSDSDVDAYYNDTNIILENYYVRAVFRRIGNETNYGTVNSTGILLSIKYMNEDPTAGQFSFLVDDQAILSDGYSDLAETGFDMGSGTVRFHINQSDGMVHDLYFTLESRADYMKVSLI